MSRRSPVADQPIKFQAKVIPRSKRNEIADRDGGVVIRVTASPTDGRANEAVIELVAAYFSVAKSRVTIVRGLRSRTKYIEIS
ncbi:MAG: DUF167 domain-containing protein [Candidatus Kerfeldbacteria bacterium]|nr:DUF167 domain-containing protein [Candidatus Kerfeldbacteria bacterium]